MHHYDFKGENFGNGIQNLKLVLRKCILLSSDPSILWIRRFIMLKIQMLKGPPDHLTLGATQSVWSAGKV